MSGFTGNTERNTVDLLTVTTWLGSDPPSSTVCRCILINAFWTAASPIYTHGAPLRLLPGALDLCLSCLSSRVSLTPFMRLTVDKEALLQAARKGTLLFAELEIPAGKCMRCHPDYVMRGGEIALPLPTRLPWRRR